MHFGNFDFQNLASCFHTFALQTLPLQSKSISIEILMMSKHGGLASSSNLQGDLIELPPSALRSLHHTKEHICVHGAFVGFIKDYHSVLQQQGISYGLPQQHAISHELQLRLRGGDIFEAHRVADLNRRI